MARDDREDAEAAYRRGYLQGANDAVEAFASGLVPEPRVNTMRKWAQDALTRWRFQDRPNDRNIWPPAPPGR